MVTQVWNNVLSEELDMRTTLTVVTPNPGEWGVKPFKSEPRMLILLHGLTGNNAQWPTRVGLEPLANQHNLAIVMPDGHRSFWLNQAFGLNYGNWVGSELPELIHREIRVSSDRSDTFIGGLSMGGYGAFRAAFDHPEQFAGAFSLSGTLNVAEEAFRGRHGDLYRVGFGNPDHPRPEDDLVERLRLLNLDEGPSVADVDLFASCGTADQLLDQNRLFSDEAKRAGVRLTYREGPGGHDWEFWPHWLPIALDSLLAESD